MYLPNCYWPATPGPADSQQLWEKREGGGGEGGRRRGHLHNYEYTWCTYSGLKVVKLNSCT